MRRALGTQWSLVNIAWTRHAEQRLREWYGRTGITRDEVGATRIVPEGVERGAHGPTAA